MNIPFAKADGPAAKTRKYCKGLLQTKCETKSEQEYCQDGDHLFC